MAVGEEEEEWRSSWRSTRRRVETTSAWVSRAVKHVPPAGSCPEHVAGAPLS